MDFEAKIVEAIRQELERQAEASEGRLCIEALPEGQCRVEGPVDLEAVAMVVAGSVAGGP
jgi:hypothetical protein